MSCEIEIEGIGILRNPVRDEVMEAAQWCEAATPVLDVRGVTKRFGGTLALDAVDLAVSAGQIHAFLGANGAGKSTLIRILADVHAADSGDIYWHGALMTPAGISKRIAIVHQDLGLIDFMSGRREHGDGLRLSAPPQRPHRLEERRRKPAAVLAELGAPLPLTPPSRC